jgi:uncharacterized membrane protein
MILLRYLYILALVLWLGGTVVAGGIVAPSIFGVLETWNPTEGRMLAGQVHLVCRLFGRAADPNHPGARVGARLHAP